MPAWIHEDGNYALDQLSGCAAADIRAYLEGERDGAQRAPEDYYAESGRTSGRWLGSGARAVGLSGEISEQTFDHLAADLHPDHETALVQRAGEHHRPGWDLTFSAPKSVSIDLSLPRP